MSKSYAAGYTAIPQAVTKWLANKEVWKQIAVEWLYAGARGFERCTTARAIQKHLEQREGLQTRQGTVPCLKSIYRLIDELAKAKLLWKDAGLNKKSGRLQLSLGRWVAQLKAVLFHECPRSVSKGGSPMKTGEKPRTPDTPVSKVSVQRNEKTTSYEETEAQKERRLRLMGFKQPKTA